MFGAFTLTFNKPPIPRGLARLLTRALRDEFPGQPDARFVAWRTGVCLHRGGVGIRNDCLKCARCQRFYRCPSFTTSALPDLRGRVPIGAGKGTALHRRALGSKGGDENPQMHNHSVNPNSRDKGATSTPVPGYYAVGSYDGTNYTWDTTPSGEGHSENMRPWAVLNYIIKT